MSSELAADVVAVERECARLIALYAQYVDLGRAADVADLFVDDGVWESTRVRLVGRAQILEGFERRQENSRRRSRHICTNTVVEVLSQEDATATTYFTLYRYDGAEHSGPAPISLPVAVGEYRDRFRRVDGDWRFAHRHITLAFAERPKEARE